MKQTNLPPRVFRTALILVSAGLLLTSCRNRQGDDEDQSGPPPNVVVTVTTASVTENSAILTVSAYGKTDALKKEKIYAPIAGRILSLKAYEGTEVRKGGVIATIQSKESQSAILGAETMLRSAATQAQKDEAEQALKLARATQNVVNITARFDGFVSTRNVSEGELVPENGELVTLIDPTTIVFVADVLLRDLPGVHPGQRAAVELQSLPGKKFATTVAAINPQSDVQSQSVRVRLQFQSLDSPLQSLLRTEMMGTVQIVTGSRRHALFVPKAALLRNDEENTYSVMTVTPDSLAKSIPVTVGTMTDSTVEVQSPLLRPGTAVITVGNYSLNDSTRVTISHQNGE